MALGTEDTMGLQDLKMFFDVEHGLFCTYQKVREVYMACRAPLKQTNKQTKGAVICRAKYSAVKSSWSAKNIQTTQWRENKNMN